MSSLYKSFDNILLKPHYVNILHANKAAKKHTVYDKISIIF